MLTVHPQRLKKGDLIGVISPAGPVSNVTSIGKGVRYLESLGYRVVVGENAGKADGYLAGTDEERAADVHAMFLDGRVKAVMCVRGGYGTPRLLSHINYKLISRNPKILAGFSDVTALQLALWKKCRLITFHGPMVGVEMANHMDPFTEEMFWRTVTSNRKTEIRLSDDALIDTLVPGRAVGRLLGGNLSLVASLLGTRYQPDFADAILFLEEVAEEPYRVDRMLTHLRNASLYRKANAILFGQFSDCNPLDPTKPSCTVAEVLHNAASTFGKPVLANLPFGHVSRKLTLPVGLRVKVDTSKKLLHFIEPAVK